MAGTDSSSFKEIAEEIRSIKPSPEECYALFKSQHREFDFSRISDDEYLFASCSLIKALAQSMSRACDVVNIPHHLQKPFIALRFKDQCRKIIFWIQKFFLRFLFMRQIRMNQLSSALAYAITSLENRVITLEARLHTQEYRDHHKETDVAHCDHRKQASANRHYDALHN